ncbi:MAG: CDP-alcohol phosphatidyltransferase family protein [Deltaproteobacteria bacterium]|nr:CDP-alcohol phosphatidyltransferase family protein [Deltaproteobacteria bacterium]
MNLFSIRKGFDGLTGPLMRTCGRLPFSPNTWTVIAWVWAIVAAAVYVLGWHFAGTALLGLRGLADHVDGYVARRRGQTSILGGVLDEMGDRYLIGIWVVAVAFHLSPRWPHLPYVAAFAVSGAFCNAFIKNCLYVESQDTTRRNGKLTHPMDKVGMFGSAEFLIYFGIPTLFAGALGVEWPVVAGIWATAVLSHVSLFQRIAYVARHYRHQA